MRAAIQAEGFSSIQAFLDQAAAANQEYTVRMQAEQERRRMEDETRRAEAALRRLEQIGKYGPQYAGEGRVSLWVGLGV